MVFFPLLSSVDILLNRSQQLFASCTAKFADGQQCSIPVFDITHQTPLCEEHAKKMVSSVLTEKPNTLGNVFFYFAVKRECYVCMIVMSWINLAQRLETDKQLARLCSRVTKSTSLHLWHSLIYKLWMLISIHWSQPRNTLAHNPS